MMPHLAETAGTRWESGLSQPPIGEADASALVEDSVTLPVQISGKRRENYCAEIGRSGYDRRIGAG